MRFLLQRLVMSADGSWSVCTHEHLTDRCSLDSALATAFVMSADGSWSVCTHEHLPDRHPSLRLPHM
jgi:hypothetical protein